MQRAHRWGQQPPFPGRMTFVSDAADFDDWLLGRPPTSWRQFSTFGRMPSGVHRCAAWTICPPVWPCRHRSWKPSRTFRCRGFSCCTRWRPWATPSVTSVAAILAADDRSPSSSAQQCVARWSCWSRPHWPGPTVRTRLRSIPGSALLIDEPLGLGRTVAAHLANTPLAQLREMVRHLGCAVDPAATTPSMRLVEFLTDHRAWCGNSCHRTGGRATPIAGPVPAGTPSPTTTHASRRSGRARTGPASEVWYSAARTTRPKYRSR